MKDIINVIADACAILTAVIAVWFYFRIKCGDSNKLSKVENYLKAERNEAKGADKGQRSILNIVAKLGLTEDEVLRASFHSKHIRRLLKSDNEGYASAILLWYEESK
jgi:hypothetical protein